MGRIGNFFKAIGRIGIVWLNRWLRDFGVVAVSIAVMVLYLMLVCAGVSDQNRLLIVLSGIVASFYFCIIVFLALKRPALFGGLITRLGFVLKGGKWSVKGKKRARGLWVLAVAPLFFTFWLAMFPTKMMGFIAIMSALCLLTLAIIAYWQKIPSNFWKAYYNFGKKAFPIIIVVVFVVYAPFSGFWNGVAKFMVKKSEQAASWLASPSKVADRKTEKSKNGKTKTISRMVAQNNPPSLENKTTKTASALQSKNRQGLRRAVVAPAEDDDNLSRAAEAGLSAFDQMRRELAELHAPKPAQKKSRSASPIKPPNWAE